MSGHAGGIAASTNLFGGYRGGIADRLGRQGTLTRCLYWHCSPADAHVGWAAGETGPGRPKVVFAV